ncbi:uncharacterized protein Hap1MRO34_002384 [Clarias gariepinus]
MWIHKSKKDALSSPVTNNILQCQYLLLRFYNADTEHVFTYNPTETVPGYRSVISKPMWPGKVRTKMQKDKTVKQFVHDIQLIFKNCQTFHKELSIKIEKKEDIPTLDKTLSVTCGDKEGTLHADKLARGEECILCQDHWFTLNDFERFSGRGNSKNWKRTICSQNTPLETVLQAGLHSKSIRTERRWFNLEEFVKQGVTLTDGHWKKDILCHGKTLNYLVKWEQDNDDVCYICSTLGKLVCCDGCPQAFHHHCHLPTLQEDTLKWINGCAHSAHMCIYCTYTHTHTNEYRALFLIFVGFIFYQHCEYLLLNLYKEDTQHVFIDDPTKQVRISLKINHIFGTGLEEKK